MKYFTPDTVYDTDQMECIFSTCAQRLMSDNKGTFDFPISFYEKQNITKKELVMSLPWYASVPAKIIVGKEAILYVLCEMLNDATLAMHFSDLSGLEEAWDYARKFKEHSFSN